MANRRGLGITRQRKPWRYAQPLPRYHARIDEGGATAFAAFVEKAMRRPVRCGRLAMEIDFSERREANRRSSRSDRSERMAWRWIGYAILMDMARGREVTDRIERMASELLRRLTLENGLSERAVRVLGRLRV